MCIKTINSIYIKSI